MGLVKNTAYNRALAAMLGHKAKVAAELDIIDVSYTGEPHSKLNINQRPVLTQTELERLGYETLYPGLQRTTPKEQDERVDSEEEVSTLRPQLLAQQESG